ncbi:DUF3574 domain-containing protein [Agrobacterium vitis]|uniref:DUF3574 domain-containing protein n=1 Tax=Agrobacterium vitis TaxID=373 RepID=A0A7K1RNF3_AGRVI|nr:DUF3574 domain-containing protein [Agrobacterium vitis]MVA59573.1 DUF3574 domain-containing protein [Agrobacterium vitis]
MNYNPQMARVILYFGLDRINKPQVTEEEWHKFLTEEITPNFPIGLTVTHGRGQYKAASGTLYDEDTKVLEIIYEHNSETDALIEDIRSSFKRQYDQESVLRVDSMAVASW